MGTQRLFLRRMNWFLLALALWSTLAMSVVTRPALAAEEAAAGAANPPEGGVHQRESGFSWLLHSSGWIGAFILGLSVYFVATVSRLFFEMRLPMAIPPEIVVRTDDLLQQRDFKSIFSVVKEDDSFYSRVLSTGIAELPHGLAEARDVMERQGESIVVEWEKKISILAVLGTLGPMIGLLGTLKGMISSFSVIAMYDTQLKASEVAGGISQALVLTFEGVMLSVPSIYFFSLFRNRVSVISTTAMLEADQFLRHFAHAARAKAPAAAAPGTGAAAK